MTKQDIIKFFEDAGYNNVEIIGDRIIFTTGEDVINWSIKETIKFMKLNSKEGGVKYE